MASGPSRLGSGPEGGDLLGGAPRDLPAAELGGSGREVGSAVRVGGSDRRLGSGGSSAAASGRGDTVSHLHTGRAGVLDPTPPTIKLEKDVEGV